MAEPETLNIYHVADSFEEFATICAFYWVFGWGHVVLVTLDTFKNNIYILYTTLFYIGFN